MLYREIMENGVMWERKAKKEKSENRDLQENRQDMVFFKLYYGFILSTGSKVFWMLLFSPLSRVYKDQKETWDLRWVSILEGNWGVHVCRSAVFML